VVLGHLLPAVPRERLLQRGGELGDAPRQGVDHRAGVGRREPHEHDEARLSLDERRDLRAALPDEQIPFPVARHRACVRGRRPLGDRDHAEQLAGPPCGARGRPWPAIALPLPQMGDELALERAPRLHVQRAIDRLVRDVQGRLVGERRHEPPRDLLRRPVATQPAGDELAEPPLLEQPTPFRPPGRGPRGGIGSAGAIRGVASMPSNLATDRRRCTAQPSGHAPHTLAVGQPPRDLFPLAHLERPGGPPPRGRHEAPVPLHQRPHVGLECAERLTDLEQRLAPLPSSPHRRPIRRRQSSIMPTHTPPPMNASNCCIHRLRPPTEKA